MFFFGKQLSSNNEVLNYNNMSGFISLVSDKHAFQIKKILDASFLLV